MKEKIPHVLYHPSPIPGLAFWRILWPAFQLGMRGEATYEVLNNFSKDALPFLRCDVVVLQRFGNISEAEYVKQIAAFREQANFRIIYDVDDIIFFHDVPDHHYGKKKYGYADQEHTKELIALCDEITVSTPFLKDYYQNMIGHKKITVLPNRIPYFWAGHFYSPENVIRNYRKHKSRPRIIYAGSASHIDCASEKGGGEDDFTEILKIIIATRKEFKWLFVGVCPFPLKKYIESRDIELLPWQVIGDLPQAISRLEGNMMIAPLMDSPFNHAKSNIKLLEASAHGMPIACQDITPYKDAPIRFQNGEEMLQKIRSTLKTEDGYIKESLKGRAIIDKHWLELEENIGSYKDIYSKSYEERNRG